MFFMNFFFMILVVRANSCLLNVIKDKIMHKIETRDYFSIDSTKKYNYVYIFKNKNEYDKDFIKVRMSIWNVQNTIPPLYIYCENKSINDIREEIEIKIKTQFDFPNNHLILLLYEESEIDTYINNDKSFTFGDVINHIKEINAKRKDGYEIYYENIFTINSLFEETLFLGEIYNNKLKSAKSYIEVILKGIDKPMHYMKFHIHSENNYYLFRLYIEDLFNIVDTEIVSDKKVEIDILKKFTELSEKSHDNFNSLYMKPHTLPIKSTKDFIEIFDDDLYLKVEIESDRIFLNHNDEEYYIHSVERKNGMSDAFFVEMMEIFKIFSSMNSHENIKGVKLVYNLLKYNDKINTLIFNIINRRGSALHMLFLLFLHNEKIDEKILSSLLLKNNYHESTRTKLLNLVYEHLATTHGTRLYLIQICLLIEAERYMNENNIDEDFIFKNFKDIYNLLDSKKSTTRNMNLFKTIDLLASHYFDHFIKYKAKIIMKICSIASLFSRLNTDIFFKHDKSVLSEKNIIRYLKLDKTEVKNYVESIRSKLLKNIQEDKKYECIRTKKKDEIMYAMQILKKHPSKKTLNEILKKALNTDIGILQDELLIENIVTKLIDMATDFIDKTFNEIKKFDRMNKELKDYLIVETKKNYHMAIKYYTTENIKNNRRRYLHQGLINLLKNEINNDKHAKSIS
ncbi:uncharacterized protein VNE69_06174 [Vairimorpha necatrix]|uniref:Uncharacterized protein n=1 Tax=Vairimorpha necatrix TaxID=6039 RepID=A0AAX4JD98_9MICR